MEFFVLKEGTFAIDKNKNFTLFDAKTKKKTDFTGSVFLDIQPFLVRTSQDLVLLDAGVGAKTTNNELILVQNLREVGVQPEQITKVLMSHLHKDHVGGLVQQVNNQWQLTFPNATHYISKPEWDWVHELASENYNYPAFAFLLQSGNVVFIEGDGVINDVISYQLTGGHTPYHTAFLFNENNEYIYFGGDILTMPQQIGSSLLVKSDKFPKEANAFRKIVVEQAIAQNWICLFYHGYRTKVGRIRIENDGFKVINP
ncbi:MBL fold metallo-hydrolase [Flavobacterium agricola]|uniref:MBL fold metallo-hydrolase n=1 Tax=Flavobacterium agricola TaxID=2870839 RepID=A0ABY6LXW5_9FLAO|nr:MBL fold metallo-hydrolase [Flavobacterium agricola]UYW00827.1 MBL fold metallo-hydrolase [Flavobacterium agricola]